MFEQQLAIGKIGESEIAGWLKARGNNVLPIYEIEKNQFKGPAVYPSSGNSLTAPDMLIFGKNTMWIEAKHKNAFSWHRISEKKHEKPWVTGIDLHHYKQYLEVMNLSDWPVWLFFLHRKGTAKDTPPGELSPTGLFCNDLNFLKNNENHRHNNHGKSGMVYWHIGVFKKLSNYPLK